jgi:hypothetical protein
MPPRSHKVTARRATCEGSARNIDTESLPLSGLAYSNLIAGHSQPNLEGVTRVASPATTFGHVPARPLTSRLLELIDARMPE